MMRLRAVKSLLVEEVGGIAGPRARLREKRRARREAEGAQGEASEEARQALEETPEEADRRLREDLEQASRKALGVVILCWTAILVLLLTHREPETFLALEGLEVVFTVGILVVATYAGFRLGQWEKYRAVRRAVEELEGREG